MKRLLLVMLALSCSMFSFSQEEIDLTEVEEAIEEGEARPPHKSPALLPRVSYSAENLYVWSPYTIDMLQVIIRDEDDDIIYNNVCVPLIPGSTTFILPSTVCTDKYSIELLYGDHHLIGYF